MILHNLIFCQELYKFPPKISKNRYALPSLYTSIRVQIGKSVKTHAIDTFTKNMLPYSQFEIANRTRHGRHDCHT